MQNIVDALTKENHKIAADGGTHDTTLLPMTTYQPVRITTADGKVIAGILKNEDSFSLQVLGKDDLNLYRFKRSDVKVFYDPQSLMPHDWDKRLTPAEFQNLLAFLTRLYVPPPPPPPARGGVRRWGETKRIAKNEQRIIQADEHTTRSRGHIRRGCLQRHCGCGRAAERTRR